MSKSNKIEVRHPEAKTDTGAYSAGVIVDGWLYVSGQGPLDLESGTVIEGTVEQQTRITLEHVDKILIEAGCTRDDVVKCTCHLADIEQFSKFNAEYAKFFQGVRPARTTVQSKLWGEIKVEIDVVARVPKH